jgi:hypothetical protein
MGAIRIRKCLYADALSFIVDINLYSTITPNLLTPNPNPNSEQ